MKQQVYALLMNEPFVSRKCFGTILLSIILLVKKGRAKKYLAADMEQTESKPRKKTVVTVKSLAEFKDSKAKGTLAQLKMCTITKVEQKDETETMIVTK